MTDEHAAPTNDPRIKRVLKRYRKKDDFFDSSMDLTGINLEELQSLCHCSGKHLKKPYPLDGDSLVHFANRLGISFDASEFDYFVHSYVRREFCSAERVPPAELHFPCEDGPPAKIPLPAGCRWVPSRPDPDDEGRERWIGVENEPPRGQS